jgi:hypothetical protein
LNEIEQTVSTNNIDKDASLNDVGQHPTDKAKQPDLKENIPSISNIRLFADFTLSKKISAQLTP